MSTTYANTTGCYAIEVHMTWKLSLFVFFFSLKQENGTFMVKQIMTATPNPTPHTVAVLEKSLPLLAAPL